MKVQLEWITPDAEKFIVRAARVSTSMANDTKDSRLLRYLMLHKHWSPFEMASACFYIECDRAVARQILRHRSFSFQEFSQRYAEPGFEPNLPYRVDAEKNRQSSVLVDLQAMPGEERRKAEEWDYLQSAVKGAYQRAREIGVAKEVARAVLPEGLTTSRMFMTGTIRSWIHYLDLRTKFDTQAEHREIALAINRIINEQLPSIAQAQYLED